jgi:hypothetical protein
VDALIQKLQNERIDTRYQRMMRGLVKDQPRDLSALWTEARLRRGTNGTIGEVMSFEEWKERVAAQGNE